MLGVRAAGADAGGPTRRSIDLHVAGALVLGLAALVLLAAAPHRDDYWAALVSILAFVLAPVFFPSVRARIDTPLCPVNWVLIVFLFHLVVDPLLVCWSGPFINTLPLLPARASVNVALLVTTLGWGAFVAGSELAPRWRGRRAPERIRTLLARSPHMSTNRLALAFAVVGLVGLGLAFHSPGDLVDYFRQASTHQGVHADASLSGPVKTASVALRPFLAFAVIVIWFRWVDERRPGQRLVWRTLAALLLVGLASATFSYNRTALVAPLLTMITVYSVRVLRLRIWFLVLVAVVALGGLTVARAYRGTDYTIGQVFTSGAARHAVISDASVSHELQIYSAAPQYLAYLLERTSYGAHLHYGRTLVSSAMFPLPRLGIPFRDTSSVVVYNRLIYGQDTHIFDQVAPFEGELFMDFALPGVIAGYLLIGLALAKVQRAFDRARDAFKSYAWMYVAIWLGFLVVGSVASVSQIAIYFFWPILVYALLRERPVAEAHT